MSERRIYCADASPAQPLPYKGLEPLRGPRQKVLPATTVPAPLALPAAPSLGLRWEPLGVGLNRLAHGQPLPPSFGNGVSLPQTICLVDFAVRQVLVGMAPMTRRFLAAMERFALAEGIDLITFERGERKDERAQRYLKACSANEGVLFIGKAQENARIVRTQRRHDPQTERITPGSSLPQPWSTTTTSSRIGCHSANSCRQ